MSSMEELLNELGMIPPGNEARNVPQNAIGKYFANKLYGGRNFLNEKFGIPFVDTGLGLGDMFMAEGPEYIEELSWGRPFIEPTGHGFRLDTRLGDILGLPLPYAGGASLLKAGGKAGIRGLSKGLNKMNPVDVSRRTFNKGLLGTIAAAGLAAKGIPLGLKDIAKPLATDVARTAIPAVARSAITNPATVKLANLIISNSAGIAYKELGIIYKNSGFKGLQKALRERGDHITFKGAYDEDIDADELIDMLIRKDDGGEVYIHRNYETLTPKQTKVYQNDIDDIVDSFSIKSNIESNNDFDQYVSNWLEQGYDPKVVLDRTVKRLKKSGDFPSSYPIPRNKLLDDMINRQENFDMWMSRLEGIINENSRRVNRAGYASSKVGGPGQKPHFDFILTHK